MGLVRIGAVVGGGFWLASLAHGCGPSRSECNTHPDSPAGDAIGYRLLNASSGELFFAGNPGPALPAAVELRNAAGERVETDLACSAECNCEGLTYDDDDYGACAQCDSPLPLRLAAGEEVAYDWDAVVFPRHTISAECIDSAHADFANPSGAAEVGCFQRLALEPGTYTLTVTVYRACTDCGCSGQVCDSGAFEDPVVLETTFEYPGGAIELVLEDAPP